MTLKRKSKYENPLKYPKKIMERSGTGRPEDLLGIER